MLLVDVALPLPLARALTYAPPATGALVQVGARVVCPVQRRTVVGVVLRVYEGEPPKGLRAVVSIADDEPAIPPDLLSFLTELSNYYLAPIGDVVQLALPPMERTLVQATREPTLFDSKKGIGARNVQWVLPKGEPGEGDPTGPALELLLHLRAVGKTPLARLEARWKGARRIIKKLVAEGVAELAVAPRPRDPFFLESVLPDTPPELTPPQAAAVHAIEEALRSKTKTTFLLHGVTGSGKTEVYLRAVAQARAEGRGVMVLVPEIALTPQLVGRYRARFGDGVAVLHSALTPVERYGMWQRLRKSEVTVVIGARSALFAPIANLGLVIVDEEHDSAFKQEEGVRYHARDMAILRAHRVEGVAILGSATPSLETVQLARSGKAVRLSLPSRARAQELPRVEIVDLRRFGPGPSGDKRLSLPLHRAIEDTLAKKGQVILFLNRRGFSPSVRCEACGELATCPSCTVSLTFHKRDGSRVICHYCDYEAPVPSACPKCKARALVLEGLGTEKLEETIVTAFPTAVVARLDRDVARGRDIEAVLARVRAREVDILVGTQMVTKGHDLPHVTLVGVINADSALSIPDFRASERGFHQLVQVAGRAGRGDLPGRVIVQTYDVEHPAIRFAKEHDVLGFIDHELRDRRELSYPPFGRLALVRVEAIAEEDARAGGRFLAAAAATTEAVQKGRVQVMGPSEAPIFRVRNRHRIRLLVRATERGPLRECLFAIERAKAELSAQVRCIIDVDPVQFL